MTFVAVMREIKKTIKYIKKVTLGDYTLYPLYICKIYMKSCNDELCLVSMSKISINMLTILTQNFNNSENNVFSI